MNITILLVIGLAAGILSGMFGIGGGIIVVPALIYFLGMSQHTAQGTTLAMLLPPIGILAALAYYRQGHVNLLAAGLLCLGFILGGLLGANICLNISGEIVRKMFGIALLLISLHMIFIK